VPSFWLGTMVVVFPSIWWGWSPPIEFTSFWQSPRQNLAQMLLPGIVLGAALSAITMRLTRTMMLEVLRQDYIRTARSKGASQTSVNYDHALRNALLPVVTIIGIEAAFLVGGLIVTETVFNIPGVARFLVEAIRWRDYPIVQNLVMLIAFVVVIVNFLVDMAYMVLDPRIKFGD
jgi:peptide/nickel transport system permease protein